MEADGQFVFEDGLQEMTGTNGFTSWLSLPHFLYASTTIQRRFLATPSESLHLSFVSAVQADEFCVLLTMCMLASARFPVKDKLHQLASFEM